MLTGVDQPLGELEDGVLQGKIGGERLELFETMCGKVAKASSGGYSFQGKIEIPSEKSMGSLALMEQLKGCVRECPLDFLAILKVFKDG